MHPAVRFTVAAVLISLVAAIFGGYSVLTSIVFTGTTVNPLVFAFLRDSLGTVLLLGAAIISEKRKGKAGNWRIDWADAGQFFILGLTGVYGSQGMSALVLKQTSATFFASMANLQPVVATVLSCLLGYERFRVREATTWGKVAGVAATVAGAAGIVLLASEGGSQSIISQSANFPLGAFFMVLQVCLGGSLVVAQKPMFAKYTPLMLAGWGYAFGTVLLLLSVITGATEAADWHITGTTVLGIGYAGVFSSGVAYGTMAFVNNLMGPTFVASVLPSQALFTALFAWIFQGKTLQGPVLGGVAVMISGILCIVMCQYRESITGRAVVFHRVGEASVSDGHGDAGVTEGGAGDPTLEKLLIAPGRQGASAPLVPLAAGAARGAPAEEYTGLLLAPSDAPYPLGAAGTSINGQGAPYTEGQRAHIA